MTAATTYTAEFRSGYRATLTVSLEGMQCTWTPALPRRLPSADRASLMEAYRTWRDECLAQFAEAHDLTVQTIRRDGVDCIAFRRREVTT